MGLSVGGLIRRGGGCYMWVTKKVSERIAIVRQNENLYLRKKKKMYHMIGVLTHLRKFVPEIVPLWLKNRNQRVHTGEVMHRGGGGVI